MSALTELVLPERRRLLAPNAMASMRNQIDRIKKLGVRSELVSSYLTPKQRTSFYSAELEFVECL